MDSTLIYMDQAEEARIGGDFQEAAFLLLKAINLRRKKFGNNSTAVSQVLMKYSEVLRVQFKYIEARKVLDEVLAINMSAYGSDHARTCDSLNALGQIHRLLGNHDEAEALLLEGLQIRRRLFGDHHVATASSLNNLAELSRERGDYFQAINYHKRSIEAFDEAVGSEHPGTINAKGNLGVTLRRQAKSSMQEGQSLVKEAYEQLQARQYTETHPWIVKFGMENVIAEAQKLQDQGKYDDSVALYDSLIDKKHIMAQLTAAKADEKQADAMARQDAGAMSSDGEEADEDLNEIRKKYRKPVNQDLMVLTEGRLAALMSKAELLVKGGRYGEADQILSDAVPASKVVLGEDSESYFRAELTMLNMKMVLGRYELCAEALPSLLQRWTDLKGPDDLEVAEVAGMLAALYFDQGLYDAASTLFVQVVEVVGHKLQYDPLAMKKTGSPLTQLYCRVLLGLANVSLKLSHFNETIISLKQAKELLEESIDEKDPLHMDYLWCYGHLRMMIADYSGATAFYQKAANFALNLYSSKHHPRLASCFGFLAQVQLKLGKWAEAAGYIEESLYMRLKHLPEDHPDVASSEHAKGSLMVALGKYSDAQVYIERSLVTRRVVLGARHADVAESLIALSRVKSDLGRPKEAREHLMMSMDIYREALGHLESHDRGEVSVLAEGENALQPHPVIALVTLHLGVNLVEVGSPLAGLELLEKGKRGARDSVRYTRRGSR